MLKTEKRIVIDAPVAEVFTYAADPKHAPEFFTGVLKVSNVKQAPNGGYTFTSVNRFAGLHIDMAGEYTEFTPNKRIVARSTGKVADVTVTVTFESVESAKTRVTCVEEYAIHGGFLGKLGEQYLNKYVDHAAELTQETLKARIEARVPTAKSR